MRKKCLVCCVVLFALTMGSASFALFSPGKETLVLAHNAYPEKGQYTDRFDRALEAGTPLAIEIDLTWAPNPKTGKGRFHCGRFPGAQI